MSETHVIPIPAPAENADEIEEITIDYGYAAVTFSEPTEIRPETMVRPPRIVFERKHINRQKTNDERE